MKDNKEVVFVDVETLAEGFSEFRLPQVTKLVGKTIELNYEKGYTVSLKFLDEETLRATYTNGNEVEVLSANYMAVSPKNNIYYVDFIWSYGYTKSVTTIIDLNENIAITCLGFLPTLEEARISQYDRFIQKLPLTSVRVEFEHAAVNTPFTNETKKHQRTNKLVGERLQFTYSANDAYEHIYLNEDFYTWQCLKGVEKGLCDTDACQFYDLGYNLVWFIWEERIVPTIGCMLEDFDEMRSYGKLYGYKNSIEEAEVINVPAGSYAKILNKTVHEV